MSSQNQAKGKSSTFLPLIELTPILIPYFIGFFIFRGLFAVFPIYIQLKQGLTDTEAVSLWATISGIALLIGAITRIPSGIVSDRIGRKNAIFIAYVSYILALFSIILFDNTLIYVFSITTVRVGLNFYAMTGRSVVSVSKREKGFKMGLIQSMVGLGSLMGPLILSYTLDNYSPNNMVWVALVFVLLDSLFFVISLKLAPIVFNWFSDEEETMDLDLGPMKNGSILKYMSGFKRQGIIQSLIQFLSIGVISGLITSVYTIYGYNILDINLTLLGLIIGLSAGLHVIIGPISGKFYSSSNNKRISILVWVGLIGATTMISLSRTITLLFVIGYLIMTASNATFLVTEITQLSYKVKKEEFSLVFGMASTLVLFGSAVANYISPYFYDIVPEGTFIFAIFLSVLSFLLVLFNKGFVGQIIDIQD
ncbi:MAG: MFS transporter [Candidatus Kariarchaeaceae archaeon]|jgi:MFS family permease